MHDDRRSVFVWDLPIRLFHWILAMVIAGLIITGFAGKLSLHMLLGPLALALVLFRLVWGVVGSSTARFSQFVVGPTVIRAYLRDEAAGRPWDRPGHNPLGALSVLALLALVLIQSTTGLFTSDDVITDGPLVSMVSSAAVKLMSKLHRSGFVVLGGFIALHMAVVLFHRFVKKDDLIVPMISGCKSLPPENVGKLYFANPLVAAALLAAICGLVRGGLALVG